MARIVVANSAQKKAMSPTFSAVDSMTLNPNATGAHFVRFWVTLTCEQPCTVNFRLQVNGVDVPQNQGGLLTVKVDIAAPKVHRQFCLEAEVSFASVGHAATVLWQVDYGQASITDRRLSLHPTA